MYFPLIIMTTYFIKLSNENNTLTSRVHIVPNYKKEKNIMEIRILKDQI